MSAATIDLDAARFREGMSRLPGAVNLITTNLDGRRFGIVATAVCSLSNDPPSLVVCVNKSSSIHAPMMQARRFAVNALLVGQAELVTRFSTCRGDARFAHGHWIGLATGAPILADAAVAFDCRLVDCHDGFSHTIFVGSVAACVVPDAQASGALLWHKRGPADCKPLTG